MSIIEQLKERIKKLENWNPIHNQSEIILNQRLIMEALIVLLEPIVEKQRTLALVMEYRNSPQYKIDHLDKKEQP